MPALWRGLWDVQQKQRPTRLMHADILAYSRSRGIFAGISLEGATLRPDNEENRDLYGSNATAQEILHGTVKPPAAADQLYAKLNRYPSKNTARYRQ
jgi:lipid-binding SYLF domain-containing protein